MRATAGPSGWRGAGFAPAGGFVDPFERRVRTAVRSLDPPSGPWLIAVSGGADSSALACALTAAEPERVLTLAHLDHGWRTSLEAEADRNAVRELAQRLGVNAVFGATQPQPGEAGSLEAGAREARYAWLEGQAHALGATAIALGHTADDRTETVLWRFLRGTQLSGLQGIPPTRELESGALVLRPLLDETRAAGVDYLQRLGVGWREDPTNADPRFLRARLRQDVLPLLRELNPRFDGGMARLAKAARTHDAWLREQLAASGLDLKADRVPTEGLSGLPTLVQERLVHDWLRPKVGARLLAVHVQAALRVATHGGVAELPGEAEVRRAEGELVLVADPEPSEPDKSPPPAELPVGGELELPGWGLRIRLTVHEAVPPNWRDCEPSVAFLDLAAIQGPLGLRGRRAGDRFWPLGAPGTRTLKRFYIDRRIPRSARNGLPVVTDNDRPMWVVGHRIDQRYRVTSATHSVLEICTEASAGEAKEG